jgi:hypothetical protein
MRHIYRLIVLGALAQWAPSAALSQEVIQVARQDKVVVSMTAYGPRGRDCRGVAIISPGAGGSEHGYRYLGEAMSSLGYFAVVIGHPESGRKAVREHVRGNGLREGLAELITEPEAYRGRFMDIAVSRQWTKGRCLQCLHRTFAARRRFDLSRQRVVGDYQTCLAPHGNPRQ